MKMSIYKFLLLLVVAGMYSCEPARDDEFSLPPAPPEPEFSVQMVAGDSNRVVITDLTDGGFQRLWDLPGGSPKVSSLAVDTVLFADSGQYTITLYVSHADGGGTTSATQTIHIFKDAPAECTPKMALLTGDCGASGKCWTFSTEGGAIKVGPTYGDFSWFTSPENGLQAAQYDDSFCFTFDDLVFFNDNNGQSVNPWNGYQPENYDPGSSEFIFLEGTGTGGRDQIIIPDEQFMGVWDADNVLDIVTLTADQLVVRARICGQDGVPAAEGWFELTFIPK